MERFIGNISRRIDAGASYNDFGPVLEAICQAYNPGWLLLARWNMEERSQEGYQRAKEQLKRFLENDPPPSEAAKAWNLLAHACYQTGDALGEIHSLIERTQVVEVPFHDLSNTANRLNQFIKDHGFTIEKEEKLHFADRIFTLLKSRISEVGASDLSRMAWLAIHLGQEATAREYVKAGLDMDPDNSHVVRLAHRLGVTV